MVVSSAPVQLHGIAGFRLNGASLAIVSKLNGLTPTVPGRGSVDIGLDVFGAVRGKKKKRAARQFGKKRFNVRRESLANEFFD